MKELKPCPFCGCEVELKKYTNPCCYTDSNGKTFWRDEPDGWAIECKNHEWDVDNNGVGIAGDIGLYSWHVSDENKERLIKAWNARHERTCHTVEKWRTPEAMDKNETLYIFKCCGHEIAISRFCNKPNYCPNCGARVVE